jgi:L-arabinokinase
MAHVAFYITGHGFGHCTRMAAVAAALAQRIPGLRLSLITPAPEWLLRRNLPYPFFYRQQALDVGVIQQDSLHLDPAATLAACAQLHRNLPGVIEDEAARLRQDGVDLVVGDIPPAAFRVARRAGLPGVGISNFSWDWIYADYVAALPGYAPVVQSIRDDYALADLLLRLPFHGPCDAFPVVRDIPMIARLARLPRDVVRGGLGLNGAHPVILLSFGGFDIQGIDWDHVETLYEYCFLTTQPTPRPLRNVRLVTQENFSYVDLIAQADAVVTKPGYGIVSDCLANRTPVLYTSRGQFAEYVRLVAGLEQFGVSGFIENRDLLAGNWRAGLEALLRRPKVWADVASNGAEVAAECLRPLLS